MSKDYTATHLDNIDIRISIPAFNSASNKFYAACLKINAMVRNDYFSFPIETNREYLGPDKSVPYTNAEIYTMMNGYNSLNNLLATRLKELYIEGINEDPST